MSKFISIDPKERKKILSRLFIDKKIITRIALIPLGLNIVILLFNFIENGNLLEEMDAQSMFYFLLVFISSPFVMWLFLYSMLKLFSRRSLKYFSALIAWDIIEISPSKITSRMLWNGQKVEINKDEVDVVYIGSQFTKRRLLGENYKGNVDLGIVEIHTNHTNLHIALDIIQNSDELLRELHDFHPIQGYEGKREEEFVDLLAYFYLNVVNAENYLVIVKKIKDPKLIIDNYKNLSSQKKEFYEIPELLQKVEDKFKDNRFTPKFIVECLETLFSMQKTGSKDRSYIFWHEIFRIVFSGDYHIERLWAISKVDDLRLGFNKKYYTHLLETYGFGPLFGTNIIHPECTDYQFMLYQYAVNTMSPLTHESERLAVTIINNVYDRLLHTEVKDKETHDNYFKIVLKYALMSEEMKNRIPEYNKEKFSETKDEIDLFFIELFEKIPTAHWEFRSSRFNFIKEPLESARKQYQ